MVAPRASKGAIKDAVRHRYGVKPVAVTVQRYAGSEVRYGRHYGTTKGFKKAIVTLEKGQTIDVLKSSEKE
jgi:ribosomal protein L23